MRIISKFNDVYDLQNSLFDPDRVWHRKSEELLVKVTDKIEENIIHVRDVYANNTTYSFNRDAQYLVKPLFIAGQVHWLHSFEPKWDLEGFKTFDIGRMFEFFNENGLYIRNYWEDRTYGDPKAAIESKLIEAKSYAERILAELRVPLALVEGIKKNDNDDGRNFVVKTNIRFHQSGIPWQEIDSNLYRLHQLLEQYIFGVLGTGEPDMISVSDKDRLISHGFDAKTSFRNMAR